MCRKLIYLVCLGLLLGLVGSVQTANAGIIASQDFTGDTTLADSNWSGGAGLTLDMVDEEIDFVKSGDLQTGN